LRRRARNSKLIPSAGRLGPVVDLMLRPALGISFEFLARRLKRWIESARPADSTADRGE